MPFKLLKIITISVRENVVHISCRLPSSSSMLPHGNSYSLIAAQAMRFARWRGLAPRKLRQG